MFSVFCFQGAKQKFGRPAVVAGTSAEDAGHSRNQAGAFDGKLHGLIKGELNHVFSPNFVANLKYSHYDQGFGLDPFGRHRRSGIRRPDRCGVARRLDLVPERAPVEHLQRRLQLLHGQP